MQSSPLTITFDWQDPSGESLRFACEEVIYQAAMNDNYHLRVCLIDGTNGSENLPTDDYDKLINSWGKVTVFDSALHSEQTFAGKIVASMALADFDQYNRHVWLTLTAEQYHLFHNRRTGAFYGATASDVVEKNIVDLSQAEHFAKHTQYQISLNGQDTSRYPEHPFLVQYLEPDMSFNTRQLARHGAWYCYRQTNTGVKLCFADSNNALESLQNKPVTILKDAQSQGNGLRGFQYSFNLGRRALHISYYNEYTGKTNSEVVKVDNNGLVQSDVLLRLNELTPAQFKSQTQTFQESEKGKRFTFNSYFQGIPLDIGMTFLASDPLYDIDETCLIEQIRYHYKRSADESRYEHNHQCYGRILQEPYRPQLVHRYHEDEPLYTGAMPGVFAQVEQNAETVTPDTIGRIPLQFPYRYTHHCNGKQSHYTRILHHLNSQDAGMSHPYYKDTEFVIMFQNGQLDKPMIKGTAATGETGHIHNDKLQKRSAISLPQGQDLLYSNELNDNNFLKLSADHQEGDHQSFTLLNNFPSTHRPGEKNLDFLQATTANYEHHATGNLIQKLGGNQQQGSKHLTPKTWITFGYFDEDNQPMHGMPYEVQLDDGTSRKGKLDATGKVHLKNLTAQKATKITYGNKTELEAKLQSQRHKLQNYLNQILAKVKTQADKDNAKLKQHGSWYRYWEETKSAVSGAADGLVSLVKGTVEMAASLPHAILHPIDTAEEVYQVTKQTLDTLKWLCEDKPSREILETFSSDYYQTCSPQQVAYLSGNLAGYILPGIIVAILSGGTSAAGEAAIGTEAAAGSLAGAAEEMQAIANTAKQLSKVKTVEHKMVEAEHIERYAGPTVQRKASQMIEQAKINEPKVTKKLEALASDNQSELKGLEYKFKSEESLSRKLSDLVRQSSLNIEQVSGSVKDVLRYTAVTDKSSFVDSIKNMLRSLKQGGYEKIAVKNTFKKGAIYKGINTVFKSPTGQKFELQFHTHESFHVKQIENHTLYEEARLNSTTNARRKELIDLMRKNSDKIQEMANNDQIENFPRRQP